MTLDSIQFQLYKLNRIKGRQKLFVLVHKELSSEEKLVGWGLSEDDLTPLYFESSTGKFKVLHCTTVKLARLLWSARMDREHELRWKALRCHMGIKENINGDYL